MKKIVAISSSRAELGLQTALYKKLACKKNINFIPIITGDNLNNYKFNDLNEIKIKKLTKINYKRKYINNFELINSISSIVKSSSFLEKLKPDAILVMGDRFEIFYICSIAFILRIPVCHLSGGELTSGSLDNIYRHSISLMSNLHLVSTMSAKKYLSNLGIAKNSICVVGEVGLQDIKKRTFLNFNKLKQKLNFELKENFIILAFHPETLSRKSITYLSNIIKLLNLYDSYSIIATGANNDPGGHEINFLLKDNQKINKNFIFIDNLGRDNFLSLLKLSTFIIGNSSSGIVEAPSLKTYSINVGERQMGRESAKSVLHSNGSYKDLSLKIIKCIKLFKNKNPVHFKNPYEDKNSINKCINRLVKL